MAGAYSKGVAEIILGAVAISACAAAAAAAPPQPISVPVSTDWFGYDGRWSAVNIRVGSPPQWVSVFPNTVGQETWVIGRDGCDGTFLCANNRGGLFLANESSTWQDMGFWELAFDLQLGDSGPGYYGYDNIALDETLVATDQIVAVVNTTEFWLGYLGLGVDETNFTSVNMLSYLDTLVETDDVIPSHSYGYTAGAYNQMKGVPASLTLGGYDQYRFQENNVSFQLAPGNVPVVALNKISMATSPGSIMPGSAAPNFSNPLVLLETENDYLFTIDSSTTFLWLPGTVCDAFAQALNLVYNETLAVYTYGTNTSVHDTLLSWNLDFTFEVADLPGSSNFIEITLPFSAFDHALSYPFPGLDPHYTGSTFNYFPLRRAANETQFTLGRVFLQEAYLIVDYERGDFSVSQAQFAMDALTNMNLIGIPPPSNSSFPNPNLAHPSSLSLGAKLGIGFGTSIAVLLIIAAWWVIRRRARQGKLSGRRVPFRDGWMRMWLAKRRKTSPFELPADKHHPVEVVADASNAVYELPANLVYEAHTPEIDGSDFGSKNPNAYITSTQDDRPDNERHSQRYSDLPVYSVSAAVDSLGYNLANTRLSHVNPNELGTNVRALSHYSPAGTPPGISPEIAAPGSLPLHVQDVGRMSPGVPSPLDSDALSDERFIPPSPVTDQSSRLPSPTAQPSRLSHHGAAGNAVSVASHSSHSAAGDSWGTITNSTQAVQSDQAPGNQPGGLRRKFSWESET